MPERLSMEPGELLLDAKRIQKRVQELAQAIREHYGEDLPTILGLLDGGLFFLVDLVRHLSQDVRIVLWRLRSYAGTVSSGRVLGLEACRDDLKGDRVLLVDDVLDSGCTLAAALQKAQELGARDVEICVLLRKRGSKNLPIEPKWVGFEIPDVFVVGYGMDYCGNYRALDSLWVLKRAPEASKRPEKTTIQSPSSR
jgi:hypoxanthine phosphoribosyltransferase